MAEEKKRKHEVEREEMNGERWKVNNLIARVFLQ